MENYICELAERGRNGSDGRPYTGAQSKEMEGGRMRMEPVFVIWSNEELDWEKWRDAFADCGPVPEDKQYEMMSELNDQYLGDERMNLDVNVGEPILLIADLGLWDGRHTGYREIPSGNLRDCLYSELDGVTWYVDRQGDFRMEGYHHDGHNHYLYRKFRPGISDEAREAFLETIMDHTMNRDDLERVTCRLGDDIARIYGFQLPETTKTHRRCGHER